MHARRTPTNSMIPSVRRWLVSAPGSLIAVPAAMEDNRPPMKSSYKLALGLTLACAIMFGQAQSTDPAYTYSGDIVNANCYQAASIVNRNSRGYAPIKGASAFTRGTQTTVPNASARQKKNILRHCSINPGTTAFALLNEDGNFFRLNDRGNHDVMSQTAPAAASTRSGKKKIRVVVTGSVDRDT